MFLDATGRQGKSREEVEVDFTDKELLRKQDQAVAAWKVFEAYDRALDEITSSAENSQVRPRPDLGQQALGVTVEQLKMRRREANKEVRDAERAFDDANEALEKKTNPFFRKKSRREKALDRAAEIFGRLSKRESHRLHLRENYKELGRKWLKAFRAGPMSGKRNRPSDRSFRILESKLRRTLKAWSRVRDE